MLHTFDASRLCEHVPVLLIALHFYHVVHSNFSTPLQLA